ncbi:MAG TPA: hypothetical protein VFD38_15195 [Myxococcaceae bacterium]|nr:hypothetical protein [Myxococcaceae bacterium]
MEELRTIRVGMSVQSADGEQLGTVVEVTDDAFRIAKGLILPKEYRALRTDVQTIAADTVTLRQSAGELVRAGRELEGAEVPAGHAGDVLRAATSTHDLAEEEDALRREAVRNRPSEGTEPPHP